ncbi:MAG: geranylgeranyl pyrophosphate synthase [Oscillospiraceae bacterium]|nr:geranylgeranyl pyrophosphate synthase [Oscillospiraceae bacterium]
MELLTIYSPVQNRLNRVEEGLALSLYTQAGSGPANEVISYFLKIPGKRLRPALTLFSAGMVNDRLMEPQEDKLIRLAVSFELLHSASLIHDDIIDDDLYRRQRETVNHRFGKKIAVLAGDLLYARAFSELSSLPRDFAGDVIQLTQRMCQAELLQARETQHTKEDYLSIIQGKTADFMALCCRNGGRLAGANEEEADRLGSFGFYFGMAYQLIDDILDGDVDPRLHIGLRDAEYYAAQAEGALASFEPSAYQQSLGEMIRFILNMTKQKVSADAASNHNNEGVYHND